MKLVRFSLCAGAVLAAGFAVTTAAGEPANQVQIQIRGKKVEAQPAQIRLGAAGELVSEKGIEKLNLSKEQKEKFDKINQEYKDKQKEVQTGITDAIKDKDRNKVRELTEARGKLRPDYLNKVEGILNDAQKKTFEEVRRESPFGGRPNINVQPFRLGGQVPGQILPPAAQQRLNLTEEQKKKLADLQKEIEGKLEKLLTEDQKKILEDMKKLQIRPRQLNNIQQPVPVRPNIRKLPVKRD